MRSKCKNGPVIINKIMAISKTRARLFPLQLGPFRLHLNILGTANNFSGPQIVHVARRTLESSAPSRYCLTGERALLVRGQILQNLAPCHKGLAGRKNDRTKWLASCRRIFTLFRGLHSPLASSTRNFRRNKSLETKYSIGGAKQCNPVRDCQLLASSAPPSGRANARDRIGREANGLIKMGLYF